MSGFLLGLYDLLGIIREGDFTAVEGRIYFLGEFMSLFWARYCFYLWVNNLVPVLFIWFKSSKRSFIR